MFDILPLPALVLTLMIVALAIPYVFPRVGAGIGGIAVVVGLVIYFTRSQDPFWASMFDELSRAIGTYAVAYGAIWIAVGSFRHYNLRRHAEAV